MQFRFATLENVQIDKLVVAFNDSFADYFVKIELDAAVFRQKIQTENIDLSKSVGAFFQNKLVGFILLGIENQTAYNGGTGVLPGFRGNPLTNRMYDFILPKLKAESIYLHQLEVVTQNIPALKTYERIGFKKVRTVACFRGKIATSKINCEVQLKVLPDIDFQTFPKFHNSQPSWQNSLSALTRTRELHQIVGAFFQTELVGYIIYSTATPRIKQFAVHPNFRRKGIGQTLFDFVNSDFQAKEIILTNIEKTDYETVAFLEKRGLTLFLEQFEMTMNTL